MTVKRSYCPDMLNDLVVPFFEQQELRLLRILTDRGTEYCGIKRTA